MGFMSSSSKGDETNLTDQRAGASDSAAAGTASGRGSSSATSSKGPALSITGKKNSASLKNVSEQGILVDFAGIGSQSQTVSNRGFGGANKTQPSGTSGPTRNGDVNVTSNITTNDPRAALAAIEATKNIAAKGMESLLANTQFSISNNTQLTNDALQRSYESGEKQQQFVEKTVADSIAAVKELALPANERGFNSTLYIVGALVGAFLYFRYKTK